MVRSLGFRRPLAGLLRRGASLFNKRQEVFGAGGHQRHESEDGLSDSDSVHGSLVLLVTMVSQAAVWFERSCRTIRAATSSLDVAALLVARYASLA